MTEGQLAVRMALHSSCLCVQELESDMAYHETQTNGLVETASRLRAEGHFEAQKIGEISQELTER